MWSFKVVTWTSVPLLQAKVLCNITGHAYCRDRLPFTPTFILTVWKILEHPDRPVYFRIGTMCKHKNNGIEQLTSVPPVDHFIHPLSLKAAGAIFLCFQLFSFTHRSSVGPLVMLCEKQYVM